MGLGGRRRGCGGGGKEDTLRVQGGYWGYSESTVGYSEDTVRVQWGTVRVQGGYSGDTVRVQWGTVRIQ